MEEETVQDECGLTYDPGGLTGGPAGKAPPQGPGVRKNLQQHRTLQMWSTPQPVLGAHVQVEEVQDANGTPSN